MNFQSIYVKVKLLGVLVIELKLNLVYALNFILNLFDYKTRNYLRNTFESCFSVYVINLDHRSDRLKSAIYFLRKMGITQFKRFPAILNNNGALGCAQSHFEILNNMRSDKKFTIICEDDIKFTGRLRDLNKSIKDFISHDDVSVLLLSYVTRDIPTWYSSNLMRTQSGQTTAFYCFRNEFTENLMMSAKKSVELMESNSNKSSPLDKVWKELQKDYIYAIPRKKLIIQKSGYSDIEKKIIKYR